MSALNDDRTQWIGGSDIAGILGISRWKTPLSVWAEKTGQIMLKDEQTLQKKLGTRLEEVVAELFTEETGKRLQRANERRVHPKYPHFRSQIDRFVVNEDALWEGKTTSAWMRKDWEGDEIPQEYIAQVMWALAITGRRIGYIAVLIGNQEFKWQRIDRDPILISEMLKRADHFWQTFIVPKVMPAQVSAQDIDTLSALFPTAEIGKEVELGDEGAKLCELRGSLWQDRLSLDTQISTIEARLKAVIKEAEIGVAGDFRVFWKNRNRKSYTVDATSYRQFTITKLKENPHGKRGIDETSPRITKPG